MNTQEKIIMLLKTLAEKKNWKLIKHVDEHGNFLWSDLLWVKEHHDPMYVAQELLEELYK